MPLRCMNSTSGSTIQAFDLSDEEWAQLVITNKTQRHLRTICCAEELVLKQSKLGTQFFAHRRSSECNASVESEQHLRLKALAVEVLRAQGWDAITEAAGDSWRADVLGIRGNARAAIEIQWSPQDDEETLRRQRRYADNGIRCLWLFRQKSFPRSRELPAARVLEDKEKGFFTIVDTGSSEQKVPTKLFLESVFRGQFKFGVPINADAEFSIISGRLKCWRCHRITTIIKAIEISCGPHQRSLSVVDFDDHRHLMRELYQCLPRDAGIGIIKPRYSSALKRTYLSNGCVHCDALIGQFFEHDVWDRWSSIFTFTIRIHEGWHAFLDDEWSSWGLHHSRSG